MLEGVGSEAIASEIAAAMRRVITPPPDWTPSQWMAANLMVPDGPRAGGRWDPSLTPYVAPIVDELGPDSPHNLVIVRKSAQTGVSVAAIGLVGAYATIAPCNMAYALPTIDALREFSRDKLQPTIDQTKALKRAIRPQTSRSGEGSTATSKKLRRGSLILLNANSAPALRSKTLQIGVADEIDEWAKDLDEQGDPWGLFKDRFTAFHATGDWRLFGLSTPKIDGASRVDDLFKQGDQRFWHITCPGCGTEIQLTFENLAFERKPPYRAHYVPPCCGVPIEHYQKRGLLRAGRFIATNPDGRHPSFHVDALISQLTTWDDIAAEAVESEGKEVARKKFVNTTLGRPYKVKGDAPDHIRLMDRREPYDEDTIPPLGLLLTCGVDVQHSGLWCHVVAYAPDRQAWTISARWLEGDTTDADSGAFRALAELYNERFDDAFGNRRRLDGMAIDAGDGGRSSQVYSFVRSRPRAYAIKGKAGWGLPPLGQPSVVDINLKGKKVIRNAARLWPVGTYDLKAEFYADLRKDGRTAGRETDPPGFCHFGQFLDEQFFLQLTAEHLVDVSRSGGNTKVWQVLQSRPNHLLDARIYANALAEHLGLTRKTQDQWRALAQRYGVPVEANDLFADDVLAVERAATQTIEGAETPPDETPAAEDIGAAFARAIEAKPETRRIRRRSIGRRLRPKK